METNPFSDPFMYIRIRTRTKCTSKVNIYGPRCVGKKTIAIYLHIKNQDKGCEISLGYSPKKLVENIELKNWGIHSIEEYINTGIKKINKGMSPTANFVKRIYEYSSGNPCVVSAIMYFVYSTIKKKEKWITAEHFERAKPNIEMYLYIKHFKGILNEMSELEKKVAYIINENSPVMIAEKLNKPLNTITGTIRTLQRKGIIYKIERGKYKIFSNAFIHYIYP